MKLTRSEIEAISIHMNACKEKLCNQGRWHEAQLYQDIVDKLDELLTAESVIRCKDCKHQKKQFHTDGRRKGGGYYIYWCELAEGYSHVCLDDDFCSRAERKVE